MKKALIALAVILSFTACSTKKTGYQMEGTFSNSNGETINLMVLTANNLEMVDSVKLDENGHFSFSGDLEAPNLFMLTAGQMNYISLIIKPGEKISIDADVTNMIENYEIKGSPDSKLLKEFTGKLMSSIKEIAKLSQVYYDSIQSPNLASIMKDLNTKSEEITADMRNFTIRFIEDNPGSLATLMALYQQMGPNQFILDPTTDYTYYETIDSILYEKYPESELVKSLHQNVEDMKESMKLAEIRNNMLGTGKTPPEIALPNPDGDTLWLSSTKGKIVLLDFWAAWCSPCRRENPNLVANYKKYHEKGFEIFQVSLDKTRESWMKGIKEDGLGEWLHVSDLKYWNSSVVPKFQIEGIPASFLLDREGNIIAQNLRGDALAAKLKEIFSQE